VLVPAEAEAIAAGYAMIMAGGSLHGVTRDWRDERHLTGPNQAPFTPTAVRDVLLRAANAGLSVHKGQIVGTGEWPAIVDPDTYATVKALLTAPERRTNRGRPAAHLLSGLLVCGTCGEPMYASSAGGAKYRCQSGRARPDTAPEGARHANRVRARLEAAVTEVILSRIKRRGTLTRPPRNPSGAVAQAIEEATGLRGQIEAYQTQGRLFDPAQLAAILRDLNARLDQAQARITAEAGTPVSDGLASSTDIRAAWHELDTAGRRAAIKEQVARITIGPGIPGTRYGPMHNVAVEWRRED
jgi:hypothetical protein